MSLERADIIRSDRSVCASVHIACHCKPYTVFHISVHIQLEYVISSDRRVISLEACSIRVFQSKASAVCFLKHCFQLSERRACRDAVEDLIACVKLN